MRTALLSAAIIAAAATGAVASCFGSENFYTCTDTSGNSYNVSNFGSSTHVTGTSASGSSWSQTTDRYGSQSFTQGTAADGSSWNSSTMSFSGGGSMTHGTDSRGNSFTVTCPAYGSCY